MFQCLKAKAIICSLLFFVCLRIPPYPRSKASVSTVFGIVGFGSAKQGMALTWVLIFLIFSVWISVYKSGVIFSLSYRGLAILLRFWMNLRNSLNNPIIFGAVVYQESGQKIYQQTGLTYWWE